MNITYGHNYCIISNISHLCFLKKATKDWGVQFILDDMLPTNWSWHWCVAYLSWGWQYYSYEVPPSPSFSIPKHSSSVCDVVHMCQLDTVWQTSIYSLSGLVKCNIWCLILLELIILNIFWKVQIMRYVQVSSFWDWSTKYLSRFEHWFLNLSYQEFYIIAFALCSSTQTCSPLES